MNIFGVIPGATLALPASGTGCTITYPS